MDPAEQVPHSVPIDKETDPVTETYSVQFCKNLTRLYHIWNHHFIDFVLVIKNYKKLIKQYISRTGLDLSSG